MSIRALLKLAVHTAKLKLRGRNQNETHTKIFSDIYANRLWGGARARELDFCSGLGSFPENTAQYEDAVVRYINEHNIESVVDLGCGDFQVSQRILGKVGRPVRYTGVDIVPDLVNRNNSKFGNELVSFLLADAVTDALPHADLLITREVLQHLSNESVQTVLEKIRSYPYALITNGVARKPVRRNVDILAGSATRVSLGSGLWLELPPFNFPCNEYFSMPHAGGGSDLRTVEYCSTSGPDAV